MSDTLKWQVRGELFEDGSQMLDWRKVEQSEWVRTCEYDESIQRLIKAGKRSKAASSNMRREQ